MKSEALHLQGLKVTVDLEAMTFATPVRGRAWLATSNPILWQVGDQVRRVIQAEIRSAPTPRREWDR